MQRVFKCFPCMIHCSYIDARNYAGLHGLFFKAYKQKLAFNFQYIAQHNIIKFSYFSTYTTPKVDIQDSYSNFGRRLL